MAAAQVTSISQQVGRRNPSTAAAADGGAPAAEAGAMTVTMRLTRVWALGEEARARAGAGGRNGEEVVVMDEIL
jgi:hypothetical protein